MLRWTGIVLLMLLIVVPASAQDESDVHRIGVRVVDGVGEFYDTVTDETFVPRGVNYIDWRDIGGGRMADRVFDTRLFDAERVRSNFRRLAENGYNTARIFFDSCNDGPTCIGSTTGPGLNAGYIANIATVIEIAAEEGIYLLLTSNDLPDAGGYWELSNTGASAQFEGYRNAHYLTGPGVESAEVYWTDVMQAVMALNPPTEALLAWSILNEQWFFGDQPPLSLDSGTVTTANGQSYDLGDPDQKRAMTTDGVLYYVDAVSAVIREYDPGTLVTMGFFAPQFPNPTATGGTWYVDTAPLLGQAALDFFDFHAYPGGDITIPAAAENFGMPDHPEIPVIMGEVGAFRANYPGIDLAAIALQEWIAASCAAGFDGWLVWEYFGGPPSIGDAVWGMIEGDADLLNALSPLNQPDPCQTTNLPTANRAYRAEVRVSRALAQEPAQNAVDGSYDTPWGSGADAPQWIAIDLRQPEPVNRIELSIAQYPAGRTRHRITATLADGSAVLLWEFDEETQDPGSLSLTLPVPLADVTSIRVDTLESPSWVAWREIEIYTGDSDETACLVRASANANLRAEPATSAEAVGSLPGGQFGYVDAQTTGGDGFTWWRLAYGAWARADVVTAGDGCAEVPQAEG